MRTFLSVGGAHSRVATGYTAKAATMDLARILRSKGIHCVFSIKILERVALSNSDAVPRRGNGYMISLRAITLRMKSYLTRITHSRRLSSIFRSKKPTMPVFFITGTSSGFGSEIAKQALSAGHKVIATSRDASKLGELKAAGAHTISLDINASDAEIQKVVKEAAGVYGTIDVLINNAGYIWEGAVEEAR